MNDFNSHMMQYERDKIVIHDMRNYLLNYFAFMHDDYLLEKFLIQMPFESVTC